MEKPAGGDFMCFFT